MEWMDTISIHFQEYYFRGKGICAPENKKDIARQGKDSWLPLLVYAVQSSREKRNSRHYSQ